MNASNKSKTASFLSSLGVAEMTPRTSPFDPGYDPLTVESHLEQSWHLISSLKISMACWQIAQEPATRRKIAAARRLNVPVCTGGGPFEVAAAYGKLPQYMDLCADLGVTRIESGEGFTDLSIKPKDVVRMAFERGLEVQHEIGKKHGGAFTKDIVEELIDKGRHWLEVGAKQIVVEARESAQGVGVFTETGEFDAGLAERFADAFGFDVVVFEAPTKASQFAFLRHFGPKVGISNVRLEELLRVEIYRRGLHSDAFGCEKLRPQPRSSN